MSGTKAGAKKANATKELKYGHKYWRELGRLGGTKSNPRKGFGSNRERARLAGAKGGKISRKPKNG